VITKISDADFSLLLALQRATHVTLHVLSTRLAALGLTPAEINALANIPAGAPLKVSELAAAIGSRPSTATSILDRLEQRGHVERTPHPTDRRAVVVSLSPSGRRAARTIHREVTALEQECLSGLSVAALGGLRAGLQAFAKAGS
jgi:DNA-binding MarR family transcriptional regulator